MAADLLVKLQEIAGETRTGKTEFSKTSVFEETDRSGERNESGR